MWKIKSEFRSSPIITELLENKSSSSWLKYLWLTSKNEDIRSSAVRPQTLWRYGRPKHIHNAHPQWLSSDDASLRRRETCGPEKDVTRSQSIILETDFVLGKSGDERRNIKTILWIAVEFEFAPRNVHVQKYWKKCFAKKTKNVSSKTLCETFFQKKT